MLISEILKEVTNIDTAAFRAWFGSSKVVDTAGKPLPVYHGAGRPDRVGTRFRKSRATSGPMAYFTDNPEVASGYAQAKADTSHEPEGEYTAWITIDFDKKKVPIAQAWWWLTSEEKQTLIQHAPHVTWTDDASDIVYDETTEDGTGGYQYELKKFRGNVLLTLLDRWLTSGSLFGDEYDFTKVLQLAGLKRRVWIQDPRSNYPFVYQVFLRIQNPLVTADIPPRVIDALTAAAAKQRTVRTPEWADTWFKKYKDAKDWITQLLDEIDSDHAWTVIPDWVTDTLISLGYDGIKDTGGKNGGQNHTVWIPFHEYQVKSAISNKKFDITKSNIHH